ncbi:MAG: Trigger factor [Syntrophus sp. SKADARSKE-3]|nr:Trigger factor [Syntrophus sp. SKADARSKE-3]
MSETSLAVHIEDVSPVKKKMSFEVPWEDTKLELDGVFRKIAKTAKIKGFRQGKVPRPVLESLYKEYAEEETIQNLVNRYYWDAVTEHKLNPLSQPQIDQEGIKADSPFSFSATIDVEPVIEPKDYLGLTLEKQELEVEDAEVEQRLRQLQEMYSTMEEVTDNRPLDRGDFAVIDFQGFVDGTAPKEMQADNYLLEIGSGSFIPGFEDQIVGMMVGENKEITVTFPAEYQQKNLAGKESVFKIALKAIKEKKLAELNEEFVKNFEQYEKFDDLKADIVKSVEEEKKAKIEADFQTAIIAKLLESNPFEVPDSLVERQIYYMMADTHRRMSMQGLDPKTTAGLIPKMRELYKDEAVKIVKTFLLLKSIAAKEAISVTPEEIADYVKKIAQQRAQEYEVTRESLEKDGVIEQIDVDLTNKKVFDYIESKAVVSLVKAKKTEGEEAS